MTGGASVLRLRFATTVAPGDTPTPSELADINHELARLIAFYQKVGGVYLRPPNHYTTALTNGSVLYIEDDVDIVAAGCVFMHTLANGSVAFELGGDRVHDDWSGRMFQPILIAVRTLQQVRVGESGRPLFSVIGQTNTKSTGNYVRCGYKKKAMAPADVIAAAQYDPAIASKIDTDYHYFSHEREPAINDACTLTRQKLLPGFNVQHPVTKAVMRLDTSAIPMLSYWAGA